MPSRKFDVCVSYVPTNFILFENKYQANCGLCIKLNPCPNRQHNTSPLLYDMKTEKGELLRYLICACQNIFFCKPFFRLWFTIKTLRKHHVYRLIQIWGCFLGMSTLKSTLKHLCQVFTHGGLAYFPLCVMCSALCRYVTQWNNFAPSMPPCVSKHNRTVALSFLWY